MLTDSNISADSKHFVSVPSLVVASARGVVASHPGLILAEADKGLWAPRSHMAPNGNRPARAPQSSTGPLSQPRPESLCSPAAARATSQRTPDTSARACWMPPCAARSLRRPLSARLRLA